MWHRGQGLTRNKARRTVERKVVQMPGVPRLGKRNVVGKSSSVSTEVELSSSVQASLPAQSLLVALWAHCCILPLLTEGKFPQVTSLQGLWPHNVHLELPWRQPVIPNPPAAGEGTHPAVPRPSELLPQGKGCPFPGSLPSGWRCFPKQTSSTQRHSLSWRFILAPSLILLHILYI